MSEILIKNKTRIREIAWWALGIVIFVMLTFLGTYLSSLPFRYAEEIQVSTSSQTL